MVGKKATFMMNYQCKNKGEKNDYYYYRGFNIRYLHNRISVFELV